MDKKIITSSRIVSVCILVLIFLATIQPPADLDLGWHLRYGEYFFQTGHVLRDNILSVIWPNFHWVESSWGYDLLVYQIFMRWGFIGVSVAAAIFSTVVFFLLTYKKVGNWTGLAILAIIFVTQTSPMFVAGLRSQTPSALFFAIFLLLTTPHVLSEGKKIVLVPALFFLWANVHGGFALALILMIILWAIHGCLIALSKIWPTLWHISQKRFMIFTGILILSVVTPILNPWGIRVYEEILNHTTNVNLSFIGEWTPLTYGEIETAAAVVVILFVLTQAIVRKKIQDIPFLVIFGVVTYLSFSAIRFFTNFGIMATFYLASGSIFIPKIPTTIQKGGMKLFLVALAILIFVDIFWTRTYIVYSVPTVLRFTWQSYCSAYGTCSEGLAKAMLKNPPKTPVGYHPYNFGGYLSWRVPIVKTFIDGRMPAWKDHGETPPIRDGDRVFSDKTAIMFRRFDSEYHFSWVIVPTDSFINEYITNTKLWRLVYQDPDYSYYVKNTE